MIVGCELDLSANPTSDRNPRAEHSKIAANGVWPLLVLPNIFATFRGRYCWDSMKTLREAAYRSVFAVVYAESMKSAFSTLGNAWSDEFSAAITKGDLVGPLPFVHNLDNFGSR